jgi:hypothetical protein
MDPQISEIGQAFATTYYQMFDSDRSQLAALYQENSMMTFEDSFHQGSESIMQKLTEVDLH